MNLFDIDTIHCKGKIDADKPLVGVKGLTVFRARQQISQLLCVLKRKERIKLSREIRLLD